MNGNPRRIVVILIFSLLSIILTACQPAKKEGEIVRVVDGDTVVAMLDGNETRLRLAQIDAPESNQPYGKESRQHLAAMVMGKKVSIIIPPTKNKDRYNRTMATLFLGNTNINAEQVRQGMAWTYEQYAKDPTLFQFQQEAMDAKRGLWAAPNPQPPWEFRKQR
ncbi:MAG: thermonuclease family protein [Magnetococcales bacterium]|nr:thermonuclease family protein [Magnetococcales bacterium]NGZ25404.1 thermonuclease family protein [Magnetococcales bacterium]